MFLSLQEPEHVIRGTGNELIDSEGRFMALIFSDSIIINTYTPTLGLDLGGDKKDKFWSATESRYAEILGKFPNRPTVWVGDMNVAPLSKDADIIGIRRSLTRTRMRKVLTTELPSCSNLEREQIKEVLDRHGLSDAFENQRDRSRGRDAVGIDRYTQYNHGNRAKA